MKESKIILAVLVGVLLLPPGAWSSDVRSHGQPVVVNSHYSFSQTIRKLNRAIETRNLATIFEINHSEMMATGGIEGEKGVTIGFFDSKMGYEILQAEPKAGLEMPLRIAIRELEDGRVDVIYYQPSYLFAHYQNKQLSKLSREFDILVGSIIIEATGTKTS